MFIEYYFEINYIKSINNTKVNIFNKKNRTII